MNSDYKNYALENLKTWVQDAITTSGASTQEVFDTIKEAVREEYYIYKDNASKCYELLALLNNTGKDKNPFGYSAFAGDNGAGGVFHRSNPLSCDKDDKSPECQKSWTSFWEENYYPEEAKIDDGMRPWGHSDLEYMIANPTLTEDRISNFPGEQYTEEELNAMCDKAAKERLIYESPDGGKTVYYRKPSQTERTLVKEEKINKWILPVGVDGLTGDCLVNLPDDLLELANLKEGDEVEWIEKNNGTYILRKATRTIKMEEC